MLQRAKKGFKIIHFVKFCQKIGIKVHFPHFCSNIGVETIYFFQIPEKGESKWRSIYSNLHRVSTLPGLAFFQGLYKISMCYFVLIIWRSALHYHESISITPRFRVYALCLCVLEMWGGSIQWIYDSCIGDNFMLFDDLIMWYIWQMPMFDMYCASMCLIKYLLIYAYAIIHWYKLCITCDTMRTLSWTGPKYDA